MEVIIVKGLTKPDKLLVLCQENAVHLLDLKVKSFGCRRKTRARREAVADKLSTPKPTDTCTDVQPLRVLNETVLVHWKHLNKYLLESRTVVNLQCYTEVATVELSHILGEFCKDASLN